MHFKLHNCYIRSEVVFDSLGGWRRSAYIKFSILIDEATIMWPKL